ncbi:MAG: hypothetical protein E7568_05050 [Ruminococcaceae bacterium]|nr:hypothetical protein [Oscillospiraceae bacterium]
MNNAKNNALILIFSILSIICIFKSEVIKNAVVEAIFICINSIIPSLYTVTFLITVIIRSGAITSFGNRFAVLIMFALSQIAGYPVGAKLLSVAVENEIISQKDAEKILPTMICAGPPFVITVIGIQKLGSNKIGVRLYIIMIISNLLLFLILSGFKIKTQNNILIPIKFKDNIFLSVKETARCVMNICLFLILLYSLNSVVSLYLPAKISTIVGCIIEVTGGALKSNNIYIICAAVSFSGLCVIMQVINNAVNIKPSYLKIIIFRILAAFISVLLLKISFSIFPIATPVISNLSTTLDLTFGGGVGFIISLVISTIVFMISIKSFTLHNKV